LAPTCDGNDRSIWDWVDSGIQYNGTHFYYLKNRHSGVVHLDGGRIHGDLAPMVQYRCDFNYARLWVKQKFSGDIEGWCRLHATSASPATGDLARALAIMEDPRPDRGEVVPGSG
jgi:hypothetical protein